MRRWYSDQRPEKHRFDEALSSVLADRSRAARKSPKIVLIRDARLNLQRYTSLSLETATAIRFKVEKVAKLQTLLGFCLDYAMKALYSNSERLQY
jgi:hypothetical protein